MSMRALVVDPSAPHGMRLAHRPEPVAGDGCVLIEVQFASVNAGDLNDTRSGRLDPGDVLGSDVAGTIVESPEESLAPGSRVVALVRGGFAERVVADLEAVAEVPATVDLARAATLPVAGLAALRSLRNAGSLLGRRVLVTGASGGVGRFAVQLASLAGAHVTASVRSPETATDLRKSGADDVVVGLDDVPAPFDVVIETVGGSHLASAWELLAPGGILQSVGWSSGEPAVLPPYATVGPPKSLASFLNRPPFADDLATLVALLSTGSLDADIGWSGPITQFADAIEGLRRREIQGKAVFTFGREPKDYTA